LAEILRDAVVENIGGYITANALSV